MSAEPLQALERELHLGLEGWARSHANRFPEIGVLRYEPRSFPAQRIDEPVSRATLPGVGELDVPRESFLRLAGKDAGPILAAFEKTEANGHGPPASIGNQIRELVGCGKSVAILCAHADGLDDVAVIAAAVAVSVQDISLIERNGVILNKAMSRESFGGSPVVALLSGFANVFWVIPETDNARQWGIPDEAVRYVNSNGVRALLNAMRVGSAVTFAPAGSAMIPSFGTDGELQALGIPPVGDATIKLLARFDAYVVAARYGGRVRVSDCVAIDRKRATHGSRDSAERVMDEALETLATLTSEVARVPVRATNR